MKPEMALDETGPARPLTRPVAPCLPHRPGALRVGVSMKNYRASSMDDDISSNRNATVLLSETGTFTRKGTKPDQIYKPCPEVRAMPPACGLHRSYTGPTPDPPTSAPSVPHPSPSPFTLTLTLCRPP